jgi:D-alanyl-D-alanine carboxypeptidase
VSAWVPTLPYATSITIDHALRHTSGLFNYTQSPDFLARVSQQCNPWAPEELLAYATLENQCFLPGTDWIYSNTNYILLGLIIEQVLGSVLSGCLSECGIWPVWHDLQPA